MRSPRTPTKPVYSSFKLHEFTPPGMTLHMHAASSGVGTSTAFTSRPSRRCKEKVFMRKNLTICLSVAALALAFGLSLSVADDKPKDAKTPKVVMPECPIMGEPVNFLVHTDTADGPVYFCCGMCIGKYKKDSEKYAKSVIAQRAAVAKLPKVQVSCPISGHAVDKAVSVDYKGEKVHFCCKECPAKFQKEPAKYATKLAASYTHQTKCPVGDEAIDPASSVTLKNGDKIYFCCDKCIKSFEKDVAKYAPKLEAQGYSVKAADLKKS